MKNSKNFIKVGSELSTEPTKKPDSLYYVDKSTTLSEVFSKIDFNKGKMGYNENLPAKVEEEYEDYSNRNFFVRFYLKFVDIFKPAKKKKKKNKIEKNEEKSIDTIEKEKQLRLSLEKINKLKFYSDKFKLPELTEIYENTLIIHNINIEKDIKIQKLVQFHMYYTDNFIQFFDKVVDKFDDRIKFLDNKIYKLADKHKALDQEILEIKKSIKSFNDNILRKKEYEKFVQKMIAKLLDSYVVENSNKVHTYTEYIDGNLILKTDDVEYAKQGVTNFKNSYVKVSLYYINEVLLKSFYEEKLLKTLTYLDGDKQKSIFKMKTSNKSYEYIILKLDKNIIDILDNYVEKEDETIDTLNNKINVIELEKNKISENISELNDNKVVLTLEKSGEELIAKYLKTINDYYENISTDASCEIEKDNLNNMLDIDMLEI